MLPECPFVHCRKARAEGSEQLLSPASGKMSSVVPNRRTKNDYQRFFSVRSGDFGIIPSAGDRIFIIEEIKVNSVAPLSPYCNMLLGLI